MMPQENESIEEPAVAEALPSKHVPDANANDDDLNASAKANANAGAKADVNANARAKADANANARAKADANAKANASASANASANANADVNADRVTNSTEYQPGQSLGGRYQVLARIGKGGMGVVYRVKQIFLDKEFALKTLERHCLSDIAIRRFQQEARAAFAIDHPNIIAVNDFGLLDDETPFLVMELINGETLGERFRRTGCLSVQEAIPIFVQVCFGLAFAHKLGIVHRDIKPNNIMILSGPAPGAEGSVKIVDFGIAKFSQGEGGEVQALTRTGEIFGSPLYMSPEQCSGERVDHRADIYSLGCVLFEALTGTPPFVGENALSTMMRHQTESAPSLREASLGADFPPAMEDIVATMLAKSPGKRYQDLGAVAQDLGALNRGESISSTARSTRSARPTRSAVASTVSMKSSSFGALLVGVVLLSGLIGGQCAYLLRNLQPLAVPAKPTPPKETREESTLGLFVNEYDGHLNHEISPQELAKALSAPQWDNRLKLPSCCLQERSLEAISKTHWIRYLDLTTCNLDNASMYKLANLPNLGHILIDHSNFDDIGALGLSSCRGLNIIQADSTAITDLGVRQLARLPNLTQLDLGVDNITDQGLKWLSKCSKLRTLTLAKVKGFTNQGLKELTKSGITTLNLNSTSINDDALAILAKMPALDTIDVSDTAVTGKGIYKLCRQAPIHSMWIAHCRRLSEDEYEKLHAALPNVNFILQDRVGL